MINQEECVGQILGEPQQSQDATLKESVNSHTALQTEKEQGCRAGQKVEVGFISALPLIPDQVGTFFSASYLLGPMVLG